MLPVNLRPQRHPFPGEHLDSPLMLNAFKTTTRLAACSAWEQAGGCYESRPFVQVSRCVVFQEGENAAMHCRNVAVALSRLDEWVYLQHAAPRFARCLQVADL